MENSKRRPFWLGVLIACAGGLFIFVGEMLVFWRWPLQSHSWCGVVFGELVFVLAVLGTTSTFAWIDSRRAAPPEYHPEPLSAPQAEKRTK